MRTIGTDCSLDVCRAEGYVMIQYDARKKFNKDAKYRIFDYYPENLKDKGLTGLMDDNYYSFNELMELYEEHKEGVDSCCETYKFVNFDTPDYYDFLNLASDLSHYCGLD